MSVVDRVPAAIHRGEEELPWADLGGGIWLKVLHIDESDGLWVVRNRFEPGARVQTHRHTGPVYAFTTAGAWKYLEYPEVNRAGSYLFEPAGSVHTLTAPAENTEITEASFAVWGCNLNLDPDGNVETVVDASLILNVYYAVCEAQGDPRPNVVTT